MKFVITLLFCLLLRVASAHYIFDTLITDSTTSTAAVRTPADNVPIHDFTSNDVRCNVGLHSAEETVSVAAGSTIGFHLGLNKTIFHLGPATIYLGRAPGKASAWDGSGKRWFKIAEWGAVFKPKFTFISMGKSKLVTTIPQGVPSGEYLVRMEHIALHQTGIPELFVSCAQIKITDGGCGNPRTVSIPGYVSQDDPELNVNIYWPVPTSYEVPGPKPYKGREVCEGDSKP